MIIPAVVLQVAEQATIEIACSAAFGAIAWRRCYRVRYAVADRPLSESLPTSVKSRYIRLRCVRAGAIDETS